MIQRSLPVGMVAAAGLFLADWKRPGLASAEAPPAFAEPRAGQDATSDRNAEAKTEAEMKPYTELLRGTRVKFDMAPIPGGTFVMGSPEDETSRRPDEGPQHAVKIAPFWMGKCEVTWDEYELWAYRLEQRQREAQKFPATPADTLADAVTRPTKPYTDMTFGMGQYGYPAICMTQLAAKTYCEWLSAKTGHYYRLPTEAEWEYACRAGTATAYSFSDDPAELEHYAWYFENSEEHYHKVGLKKPNPWGLHDMHGSVAEWCLDQHSPEGYAAASNGQPVVDPLTMPQTLEPRVVRGGSWDDDAPDLRSAARRGSHLDWKIQDPQIPQSIWYYTDALFVGFRVVRPLHVPTQEQKAKYGPDKIQMRKE